MDLLRRGHELGMRGERFVEIQPDNGWRLGLFCLHLDRTGARWSGSRGGRRTHKRERDGDGRSDANGGDDQT